MKVEIPNKICPHCGGTTWSKNASTGTYTCIVKVRETAARVRAKIKMDPVRKARYAKMIADWTKTHKEQRRISAAKSYQKHRDENLRRVKKYRQDPKVKQRRREYHKQLNQELYLPAVKVQLKSLGVLDPTPEQVERYRTHLKTLRQWRQVKNQLE